MIYSGKLGDFDVFYEKFRASLDKELPKARRYVRPTVMQAVLALLREFPQREMRARDARDWLAEQGKIPENTYTQDVSKCLAQLAREGLAERTSGRGSKIRGKNVWYALALQ